MRDYVPQHDRLFDLILLRVFANRPGEPVDPVEALGLSVVHRRYVTDRIRYALRRRGYIIEWVPGYQSGRYIYRGHQ